MADTLPGHIPTSYKQWIGSGHGFVNQTCEICGHPRQSLTHRAIREQCSKQLQVRHDKKND